MYSTHHDDPQSRVRHVPIQVESRTTRPASTENQTSSQWQQNKAKQQSNHHHQEPRGSSTLPNTSSVKINYQPPSNRHSTQHRHENNQPGQEKDLRSSSTDPSSRHTINEGQLGASRTSSGSPPNSTKNDSDKLVGSPEPIPLPSPGQLGNCGGKTDTSPDMSNFADKMPTEHTVPSNRSRQAYQQHHQQHPDQHQQNRQQDQQRHESPNQQHSQPPQKNQNIDRKLDSAQSIVAIKVEIATILDEIERFEGDSQKTKEYRFLDEMLTRCVLNLDKIECGGSQELRQQRKAAIKLVDRATEILQKKQQFNQDTNDLSKRKEQLDSDIKNLSENILS